MLPCNVRDNRYGLSLLQHWELHKGVSHVFANLDFGVRVI